ncbi:MAG: nitrile hydratase subunit alpha [Acidobacteria bacterium]|nr:nitrile hydratase subunit alpha [Acidobacteriota bacterium]MBV9184432.1 nitrile hydratase subunit alpha [Acidobacteriota bacterium]
MSEETHNYEKVIARAWSDDAYRDRLLKEPAKVLEEAGWKINPAITVKIAVDSTQSTLTLGLPAKPADLNEEHLGNYKGTPFCSSTNCHKDMVFCC